MELVGTTSSLPSAVALYSLRQIAKNFVRCFAVTAVILLFTLASEASGQRIRFPETPPPTSGLPNSGIPGADSGVIAPQSGAVLGNPSLQYDPFAPPGMVPAPPAGGPYGMSPYGASPYGATPYGMPPGGPPPAMAPFNANPYAPGPYPAAPYANPYPPQGIFGSDPYASPYFRSSQEFLNNFEQGKYMRVVQEFHYRHTWLEGSTANEVDIHDAELGFTLNWPNFLGSGEPLQISPTFIFHFWDGPQPPSTGDLPSRAYSAFLASSWTTPTNRNFGGEIVTSVGVYSDFQTFTSRSLRVKGTGLGWVRLTPNMLLKFGVSYLNRLDVKILPVGGIYWKPSDLVEMELYFPNPKIKYKLPQIGNTEFNAYVTANYGGDSWTVQRVGGFSDQVDLIDLRVLGGVEFIGFRGLRGFFEAGYAFDRELLYRVTPAESIKLSDSVILRAGFLF